MSKSPKPPPAPDYAALATQQAGLQKQAIDEQTLANRTNQVGPYGSKTYAKDPSSGQWTENTQYSPQYQQLMDTQRDYQQQLMSTGGGMLGNIQQSMGQPADFGGLTQPKAFSTEGLNPYGQVSNEGVQGWGQLNMPQGQMPDGGWGQVDQVRQAMMGLQQPGLDAGREAEIARLKSQGLTEGSRPFQSAMQTQGDISNRANMNAVLGANQAYGDVFNRQMQARQQGVGEAALSANYANSLRGQQMGENMSMANYQNNLRGLQTNEQMTGRAADTQDYQRQLNQMLMQRQMPLQEYGALMGAAGGMPQMQFGNVSQAGVANAPNLMGAADDSYKAQLDQYNAGQAGGGGMASGLMGLAGTALGSFAGPLGAAAGSAIGKYAGDAMFKKG